jgi:hypothetical protein
MNRAPPPPQDPQERLWRNLLFGFSAAMGGLALVDLDAGRLAGAAGDAGAACLMISLIHQYPVVRAILGSASGSESPERLQREAERLRSAHPWTERVASVGWSLLFGSLLLRALGVD